MAISIRRMSAWYKLLLLLSFAGCYKNHLYVQQEWVDRNFLASTHVGTPDPRQANPPEGQRLLIAWDFPRSLFQTGLTIVATIRFWGEEQIVEKLPLARKRGYKAYFFPNRKILTYRVQVVDAKGAVVEVWNHQFWTELIEVGDKTHDAERSSSSVSSQPMQESVIDTP